MRKGRSKLFAVKAAILAITPVHGELVLQEAFDYTIGEPLVGAGAVSDGWNGAWSGGNWDVVPGQSFGSIEVTGGAVQRPSRSGNAATSREITAASQTALVADDSTLWFSVLLQATGSPAADLGGTAGFATNTWGTLVFGDSALSGGSGNGPAPIGAGGNAVGVGFQGGNGADFANVQVQGVIYNSGTPTTTSDDLAPVVGESTIFIVGSVEWAANGTEDTLTLYSVTDPSAAFLPPPFTTLTADLDQSTFNVISIGDAQTSIYDEIRFGTELEDVSPLPFSPNPPPTIIASASLVAAGDSVDLGITFDPAADTATLSTQGGPVDLIALDDGSTNGDLVAGDGKVSHTDSPTSSYAYVVDTTKTGSPPLSASTEVMVADPSSVPTNAFSSAILADSPLFYYRFEEPAESGYLTDVSGNGFHTDDIVGTLDQGSPANPGGLQNAGNCPDNVGIRVTNATTDISSAYTLVAVINANDIEAPAENFFSMADGSGTGRSIFGVNSAAFETFTGGKIDAIPAPLPSSLTTFLVHCVFEPDEINTAPEDFVSGEMRVYIDGILEGSAAIETEINEGEWVLGSHKGRTFNFFDGFLDETAVFESVLSNEQIAAHGAAFLATADPLLGFVSESTEIIIGESTNLNWKISDLATAVEINGVAQAISGGGLYSNAIEPTEDTNYMIEVFFSGGSVTRSLDVAVVEPPEPPRIISISTDTASPPNVTIEIMGEAGTSYNLMASSDLLDGFLTLVASVTPDETGFGTTTFIGFGDAEFYRLEY